jgi:hypothetical protein
MTATRRWTLVWAGVLGLLVGSYRPVTSVSVVWVAPQGIVLSHSPRSNICKLFPNPTGCSAPRQTGSTPIFEQYGLISTELENAILDNFAIQLLNDPDLTGKVTLRRGQYSSKFASKKLLRIKNYIFKQSRVPANRVSAFEVRRGPDFTVELYLVSKTKRG